MSYTVQEIHEHGITILDELSDNGSIDVNKTREYANRAPRLLNMWQWEIARIEGITQLDKITSLSQTLQVSDRNCMSGSYYLAMHYALADMNDEMVGICRNKYEELKREAVLPAVAVDIIDVYSLSGGEIVEPS